jgi:hypothetical protein
MLMKHIWTVLCKESVINQDDNVISLNGVLEEITSTLTPLAEIKEPKKIIILFNYEIVSYWTKEDDKEVNASLKLTVIDPKGVNLNELVKDLVFPKESKRLRTRLKIQGLQATDNGRYLFKVSIKFNENKNFVTVSEVPLDIKYTILPPQKVK